MFGDTHQTPETTKDFEFFHDSPAAGRDNYAWLGARETLIYVSIFGALTVNRTVYGTRDKQKIQAVPLDAQLGLPDGDFSYLLQAWLQECCLDTDYAGAVQGLAAILHLHPSVRSVEHMTRQMAADVANFQVQQPLPAAAARPGSLPERGL